MSLDNKTTGGRAARILRFLRASHSRLIFLFFGIPTTVFMAIVFVAYLSFFTTMFFFAIFIVGTAMLPGAIISRRWYRLVIKLDFVFLIAFTCMVPNPLYWSQQVERRLDHSRLVTPSDPAIVALNNTGKFWGYLEVNRGIDQETFWNLTERDRAWHVFRYVRNNLTRYIYDIDNQGVFDYAATPAEVLARGQDDCQGITCVTVSFLIYLGIDAYVAECPFHWYIRVFPKDGSGGSDGYFDIYRSPGHTEPMYIFNDVEVLYLADPFTALNLSLSFPYIASKYDEIVGNGLDLSVISRDLPEIFVPAWLTWSLVFATCVLLGLVVSAFLAIPGWRKIGCREKISRTLSFAAPVFLGFVSVTFLPYGLFLSFGSAMIWIGVACSDTNVISQVARRLRTMHAGPRPTSPPPANGVSPGEFVG